MTSGAPTGAEHTPEWKRVADGHPPPHARYEVYRAALGVFVATPCYGMHSPWWVPRTVDVYAPGACALAFEETDEWRAWGGGDTRAAERDVARLREERDEAQAQAETNGALQAQFANERDAALANVARLREERDRWQAASERNYANYTEAIEKADERRLEVSRLQEENARLRQDCEKYRVLVEAVRAERDALQARNARLEIALEGIASFAGKTLIGDGRYDEGANAAFEQAAELAQAALAAAKEERDGE